MKRPLIAVTAILITSSLAGCVFLPALAAPSEPDEEAFLNEVEPILDAFRGLMTDEVVDATSLEAGYDICRYLEGGMRRDAIVELTEDRFDNSIFIDPDDAELFVQAAEKYLCV